MSHNCVAATRRLVETGSLHELDDAVGAAVKAMHPPAAPLHEGPVLATSATGVLVPIRGTEHMVHHAVANEMSRMRDGLRGAVAIVEVAMSLRDDALDLVAEMLGVADDSTGEFSKQLPAWRDRADALIAERKGA